MKPLHLGILTLTACLQSACFHASDPVLPAEYRAAELACAPMGGLVSIKVTRWGSRSTAITAQCANGAVIEFRPMPITTQAYYTLT